MIIKEKLGRLNDFDVGKRTIDPLPLEWHETCKRILHKRTLAGKEIILKFLNKNPNLTQDDVVYEDEYRLVVIDIQPCDAIVLQPASFYEAASLCYEIGNKHLPLFFQEDTLLVPYDAPLFRLLAAAGFQPKQEKRKLLQPLKTSVSPHEHSSSGSSSLFSKILQMAKPSSNV